ncbi:hypothetical protein JCM5296_005710, partial [Sporobolomyces johnsonii]
MFDLVTEPEVFSAQRALANEMGPQISELIRRAEGGLEGLKARERGLRAKVDKRNSASRAPTPSSASAKDVEALEKQLEELQRRKDRLGAEVERLEGQVEAASAKGGRR